MWLIIFMVGCITPLFIMGFVADWREKQQDKQQDKQNNETT